MVTAAETQDLPQTMLHQRASN